MDKKYESLKTNLAEQFKDKQHINDLLEVIDKQFIELYQFFKQLDEERNVYMAQGRQLDGIGDIVSMTRKEAQELSGEPIPLGDIDDETYRQYLIYKILKNTSNTTYPEIIKAFRMFWDRPIYYREDPEQPATMIFDTGEMEGPVDTTPLFKTPLIRPAGVTLKLFARTSTPVDSPAMNLFSGLGYAITETLMPYLERDIDFGAKVSLGTEHHSIAQSMIPELKNLLGLGTEIYIGKRSKQSSTATSEENIQSIMETPIGGISTQN